jgi:hypothetical protein
MKLFIMLFLPISSYEGLYKLLQTVAVKIIKPTIRPISHHHHQSSSLLHADTGPTISAIFGTLPGSPFLSECQALPRIWSGSPHWYQTSILSASISLFGNRTKSQGVTSGQYGGWGMPVILSFARNCWVRTEV